MTCRVPSHGADHSDAAKRMSDATRLAWEALGWDGTVGKWMAFKLEDGSTNNDVYDRKQEAVRHNDEFRHCFIRLHPFGMNPCEAQIMLKIHRDAYDAGFRLADPDSKTGGKDIILRTPAEKLAQQMRSLSK